MDARWGPFGNCTHIIVSLLKAWKVRVKDRVQWCHFLKSFQEGPHQIFTRKKFFFEVDIVKYIY